MRTRTAKKLAQRIDLNYFKRPHPLRRWRTVLSIAAPTVGLLWLGGMAAAGSMAPYSSGPVSSAHAFAEPRCEVCHVRETTFRAHVGDKACLTCHDGPAHPPSREAAASLALPATARQGPLSSSAPATQVAHTADAPACASCHREHQGRVALSNTADEFCLTCHEGSTRRAAKAAAVSGFPDGHPPFTTANEAVKDPGTVKFNHEVHAKPDLRGPKGPEKLECSTCHQPEIVRASSRSRVTMSGLMQPIEYEQQCARCHPLFFDERIEAPAPHGEPKIVRAFVERALREHITRNPGDISKVEEPRRIPLNFPRPPEPPARTPEEWVARRTVRAERLLWGKACAECHQVSAAAAAQQLPTIAPANLRREWMSKAAFDHTPHLMVRCESCHAAEKSRNTSDVLMPAADTCATCHAPSKGASSACAECHAYHDWSKARPVKPHFALDAFR
jgi:predicted CXXCH cytochrome family protein